VRTYGADTKKLLEGISTSDELGKTFGHGLYEREIKYLVSNEWARSAEDILWRRTKLGYDFSQDEALLLDEYVARHISA
jgi:glycerol-3-phosphate dehydrogenase